VRVIDDEPDAQRYTPPRNWPAVGEQRSDEDLAEFTLGWIHDNAGYLRVVVRRQMSSEERARRLWEATDVITRMAYRASRGQGLTLSVRHHVRGTKPAIKDPHAVLYAYAMWVVKEYRKRSAVLRRYEITGESRDMSTPAADEVLEAETDTYFIMMIEAIAADIAEVTGSEVDRSDWAMFVRDREKALWEIFCRTVPPAVAAEVATWSDDDRRCVLLGLFPLNLPHGLIASYRTLLAADMPWVTVTADGTRKLLGRLRQRMIRAWPTERLPSRLRREPKPDSGWERVPRQRGGKP
jgi:hypothetical protein